MLLIACPSPSGGGKQPDSADATLTFQQVAVRTSKHLVDANGGATQTFTNTLLNNGTPVTAGAAYSITEKPAGLTNQITVNPTTGEVTFGAVALTKVNADGPQTVTVQAAYQGKTASYAFTVTDHFSPRRYHASVVVANRVYVIGGFHGSSDVNRVWRSDTDNVVDQNWTQVATGTRFSARRSHSAVVLDGAIYVISGFDGTNRLNDVWRSADQGVTWTNVHAAP